MLAMLGTNSSPSETFPCWYGCWCLSAQVVLLLGALLALLVLATPADAQGAAVQTGTTPRMMLRGLKRGPEPNFCRSNADCGRGRACQCLNGVCGVSAKCPRP
jgi:hypothetical protein